MSEESRHLTTVSMNNAVMQNAVYEVQVMQNEVKSLSTGCVEHLDDLYDSETLRYYDSRSRPLDIWNQP